MKSTILFSLLISLFPCIFLSTFAQSINSSVAGNVHDETGAAIPGVKVTLVDLATRRELVTVTNTQGAFVFPDVRAGLYKIFAIHDGFKKSEVTDIKVNVSIPATISIELKTGEITDVITTTSSESQATVNLENAELSTTVLSKQINDLPLNGRNPIDLANLQAGVNQTGNDRNPQINGLRGTFSNITWDGVNINDNFVRSDSLFGIAAPSVVSVAEFSVTTQNSNASDGLGVAQIKLATPRGSDKYHASLFEFHRNDLFDANTFFNNSAKIPKEKLIRNQFGFGLGGPVQLPKSIFGPLNISPSKKIFFYGYYEGTRERSSTSLPQKVLSAAARNGEFTYRRSDNRQLQTINLLTLAGSKGVIDPIAMQNINLTPPPNDYSTGDLTEVTRAGESNKSNIAGYRFNSPSGYNADLWGFRIDYDATDNHRFEAIYSRYTYLLPNDVSNDSESPFPGLPGGGQQSARPRGSFAWNWTPNSNIANELRFGFSNYDVTFFTNVAFASGYRINFPLITNPVQNSLPQGRISTVYELTDNAYRLIGNHVLRFGGNWRRVYNEPYDYSGTVPTYTLGFNTVGNANPISPPSFPGGIDSNSFSRASSILSILTGTISGSGQTFNITNRNSGFVSGAPERQKLLYHGISGFINDTWKITPKLSLNIGLRYEFISVPTETRGLLLMPLRGEQALPNPEAVLDFTGTGTGRKLFANDFNNFAPSVGISWDPFGNGKTAVRAGYSISYVLDNNITTALNAASQNQGINLTVTIPDTKGTLSQSGIAPVPPPEFKVPRTIIDNIMLDTTSPLFAIADNYRTPYVQQWTFGIEREIFRDTLVEIRYVGNRGTKLTRGIDKNQVIINGNGFLDDFKRAQRNLAATGDPYEGETLTIFPRLGGGGDLTNSNMLQLLSTGQVGELASVYLINRYSFLGTDSELGADFFLPVNENAFAADYIGNGAFSTYNGLQTEIRRRFRDGIYFQGNYTFSKGFTDFNGSQSNFSAIMDLNSTDAKEKMRSSDDFRHVFKANAIYDLPFGYGKRFFSAKNSKSKLVEGWSLNSIFRLQSGVPISIVSTRGTVNRSARSSKNTINSTLSIREIQKHTGIYKKSGRVSLFAPALLAYDSSGNDRLYFNNPEAGELGELQMTPLSGPWFFNLDMSFIKRTHINDKMNVEFRADAFNLFNRANFNVLSTQNINSSTFGVVTSTFEPRILQFAVKLNF